MSAVPRTVTGRRAGREFLSGNEAAARGAWEAGVEVAAAYPGTPSTEILQTLAELPGVYAEWSTNEKVALEVALGASMTGDMDYLMRVQVGDLEHYSRFIMDKLLKQPGVIDIRSNFVLERIKETTALPLEQLA